MFWSHDLIDQMLASSVATKSAVSSNNPKPSSIVTLVLIIMIQHALHDQQNLYVTKVTSALETVH